MFEMDLVPLGIVLPLCMTLRECMCSRALQICVKYLQIVLSGIRIFCFLKCYKILWGIECRDMIGIEWWVGCSGGWGAVVGGVQWWVGCSGGWGAVVGGVQWWVQIGGRVMRDHILTRIILARSPASANSRTMFS